MKMDADNQRVLDTEMLDHERIGGGKLPAEGITLRYLGHKTATGKNGEFMIILGKKDDGTYIDIQTSSGKLQEVVKSNEDYLMNKRLNISGRGTGFERQYTVRVL
jgi:hypothetical protein